MKQILKSRDRDVGLLSNNQQGQALVEAALILPILLIILLTIFMLGIWINRQYVLDNTASQAVTKISLTGRKDCGIIIINTASMSSTGKPASEGLTGNLNQGFHYEITSPLPTQGKLITLEISSTIPLDIAFIPFLKNPKVKASYIKIMQVITPSASC